MTEAEVKQLTQEMTESKLSQLSAGITSRNFDQPLKVVPAIGDPPKVVRGYFTQQKFIWGKTPEEMEVILGIFGKLRSGAYILQFKAPLKPADYENRAYTYFAGRQRIQARPGRNGFPTGLGRAAMDSYTRGAGELHSAPEPQPGFRAFYFD